MLINQTPHSQTTVRTRSLGISLPLSDLSPQVSETGGADVHIAEATFFTYISYARAWTYLFPLVTEAALFGACVQVKMDQADTY